MPWSLKWHRLLDSIKAGKSLGASLFPTKIRSSVFGSSEIGAPSLICMAVCQDCPSSPDLGSSFILPADACLRIRDGLLLSGHLVMVGLGLQFRVN